MNKQMVQKEKTLLVGKLRSIGHFLTYQNMYRYINRYHGILTLNSPYDS